jgi:hypothetical protein
MAAAFGAVAIMGSVMAAGPAHAQTYGGGTVDCYIDGLNASSPMSVGQANTIIAHGGNHGNEAGTCHVSGHISKNGGSYNHAFASSDLSVNKNGTFEVHFTANPPSAGTYTIQVCASASGPDAIHPADDCKTITRDAVKADNSGKADCYIGSISAPSPLKSGQRNDIVGHGGNHGTADGTCAVSGHIETTNGSYSRDFRTVTISVAKGGTFDIFFADKAPKKGKYTIQVCAHATGGNATHPADDCKTISRTAS